VLRLCVVAGTLTHFYFYKHNVSAEAAGLLTATMHLQIWRPNGRGDRVRNLTLVWTQQVPVSVGKPTGELYQVCTNIGQAIFFLSFLESSC
jgi:hypothetical protein